MLFIITFIILSITAISMMKKASKSMASPKNNYFKRLQVQYLIVYYNATFADWLQGPYVYKVYSDYGYTENKIAILYIVGFASSSIFGTFVGHLADTYGRKSLSASFGIVYSFCCLTKLSSNFYVLFFGRICGGISTSILCTTFEAWYINEHTTRYNLPMEWLNLTFSKASFYNGLLAIIAGVVSQISAEVLQLGPISPFLIAIPFLVISTSIIMVSWTENDLPAKSNSIDILYPLKLILFKNPKLMLICLIQSLYEATMYTFIFSWTPIINSLQPPLGLVFASFMVAFMIGSKIYALLISKRYPAEIILLYSSIFSFMSLSLVTLLIYVMKNGLENGLLSPTTETFLTQICFFCFIIFEICVGLYVPAIGYIKGRTVPEEYRASITNWFRVPMNILTCLSLTLNQFYENDSTTSPLTLNTFRQFSYVFYLCSAFLIVTLLVTLIYIKNCKIIKDTQRDDITKTQIEKVESETQIEK